MTEKNITLDLLRSYDGEVLRAVRGDTESRTFIFTLCHGSDTVALSDGVTVLFSCDVNGTVIADACEISGGKAVYTLKSSYTSTPGTFPCELSVFRGTGDSLQKLYCTGLTLFVEDSLADMEGIEADDRYLALDTLVNRAESAAAKTEEILAANSALVGGYGIVIEDGVVSLSLVDGEAVSY